MTLKIRFIVFIICIVVVLILILVGYLRNTRRQRAWTSEDMRQGTATIEELEHRMAWTLEHSNDYGKNNLRYLVRGRFVSPANDIDLQTIERFIFEHGMFHGGRGLVIDRMHGRVYYNPHFAMVQSLQHVPFSGEFTEDDLNKLIQAIEESNLLNWREYNAGRFDERVEDGGSGWAVGILFSDGSILRRGGSGDNRNYLPPVHQYEILTSFIETLGAEIIERHNLRISNNVMGNTARQSTWTTQDMTQGTATIQEIERQRAWALEHSRDYGAIGGKYRLGYLIRGRFASPPNDVDLQTIERFIFTQGSHDFAGVGIVIDRMHGRVYYSPCHERVEFLDFGQILSAEFVENDLNRLIEVIKESNLLAWQERYITEVEEYVEDGHGDIWFVGILFSDGSILRRRGDSDMPHQEGLAILTNFIKTMSLEIAERHNSEIQH